MLAAIKTPFHLYTTHSYSRKGASYVPNRTFKRIRSCHSSPNDLAGAADDELRDNARRNVEYCAAKTVKTAEAEVCCLCCDGYAACSQKLKKGVVHVVSDALKQSRSVGQVDNLPHRSWEESWDK
ncbi:MAG: hypothetical protein ACREBD_03235, partial [Blastocatellia bacterium]